MNPIVSMNTIGVKQKVNSSEKKVMLLTVDRKQRRKWLANRMLELRTNLKWDQSAVKNASRGTISKIENSKMDVTVVKLESILQAYGLTLEEFFSGKQPEVIQENRASVKGRSGGRREYDGIWLQTSEAERVRLKQAVDMIRKIALTNGTSGSGKVLG